MSSPDAPTHIAYALKRDGRVSRWVEIGVGSVHEDGNGFDVMLDRLPVSGFNGHVAVRSRDAGPMPPEEPRPGRPMDW